MALTQGARNKIKSFVQSTKKLLVSEFASQIQQHYGIRPDGSYLMVEELTSTDGSIIQTARLLRERLAYLEDSIAGKNKKEEAVEQLLREQAFTILNRFAALRMAEERNIIPETIRSGYNSEGFQVFDQLSGGAQTADQFERYTWFLKAMFDELAIDLPAVFDRFSPYALLFPSEKVMLELLDIIDDNELSIYREEGQQPINLWEEDETIGWVYQYYNSREEISAMREASGAPRNSRELAVRNQFFTPRYVVQFLVDNSLGRQWFEMTKGQTSLVEDCQYMVKREQEIFLDKGEAIPDAKIEGANYIEYRVLKDPREILMLDPACGSMHFGLYCFDLFEQVYIEAWDNYPNLMPDLRDKYLRDDYIKRIPGYILMYNIHGVDIDPRAIQIAGLSLWLRAQKSYKKLGLQPVNRPTIKKSNLVVAEPMPGEAHMLSEFTQSLPGPIGKLVRVIWDKMKLAGETGLLLKIEEELKNEIEIAREEYKQYKGGSIQTSIFGGVEDTKVAEMAAIYGKDQKITKDFFDTAEEEVLKALKSFSENAEGEDAFQKLLFAEDTARGFAFIELCRKRYDVIVMNPPFGACSVSSKDYIFENYGFAKTDLSACFVERMKNILVNHGAVGAITTRTLFYIGEGIEKWRKKIIFEDNSLKYFVDFGLGVLDAMVETACFLITKRINRITLFSRITEEPRAEFLKKSILENVFTEKDLKSLSKIPGIPLAYWINNKILKLFDNHSFDPFAGLSMTGLQTSDNNRFCRLWYEVSSKGIIEENWAFFITSDSSTRYFYENQVVVNYEDNGNEVKLLAEQSYGTHTRTIKNEKHYFKKGLSWSVRTTHFKPHFIPSEVIDSVSRPLALLKSDSDIYFYCGLWNTYILDYILKLSVKNIASPKFNNTIIKNSPVFEKSNFPNISKKNVETNYRIIKALFSFRDSSIYFIRNHVFRSDSISKSYVVFKDLIASYRDNFIEIENKFNEDVINVLNLNHEEIEIIKTEINYIDNEANNSIKVGKIEYINNLFSILVGCSYGRWDLRILKNWDQEWNDEDIFKGRKHSPFLYGSRESTLDLVLPEYHDKIKEIWAMPYPIDVLEESATVSDISPIVYKLKEVIKYFWTETYDTIEEELTEHFKVNDLSEVFDKHSKFFDTHLKAYSRNKRVSPIYWHLGVPSGNFNVWIYYPKLNENSLFKIVNELVEPKLEEVKKQITAVEMTGSSKELYEYMQLRDELLDFKEELLLVTQLPYKPNQDDGVIITAAPLHNLFRHTKWRKSTEDCWKSLQKGDYDWAHLAYSIWPDRVANKCKKDLSMAIAHGLESICEIKPKETKEKKKPEIKEVKQNKLL